MLISNFNKTIDICRRIKTPIVAIGNTFDNLVSDVPDVCQDVSGGFILGTYDDLCILRMSPLQTGEIDPRHLDYNEWVLVNKASSSLKEINSDIVPKELIDGINSPIRTFYVDVNRELNLKWINVKRYIASSRCVYSADFKSLPQFEEFNNRKADDGAMILRLTPELCFFIYKALVPYAKADTVSLYVFSPIEPGCSDVMVCFKTARHKAPPIYTFVKYLIDRRNN